MDDCAIPKLFEILGQKWVLAILKIITEDEGIGFNELKNKLGITPKILTSRLHMLELEGYIQKDESNFKHAYSLTKEAQALKKEFIRLLPILEKIEERGKNNAR